MIESARDVAAGSAIDTDLCIIGGGPAGIALALEFAGAATRVCLLESGGLNLDIETQDLNSGASMGWPYWPLAASRVRFLGGTTNHWGGVSLPLNPEDFQKRPWVENSGWPLGYADLSAYYQKAQALLGLENTFDKFYQRATDQFDPVWNEDAIATRLSRRAKKSRFGLEYRSALEQASNIRVLLHANATEAALDDAKQNIHSLGVACLNGPEFQVRSKVFVLATGGIENARFLLSADPSGAGIGNSNDLVGRYFSDHPYFSNLAKLQIFDPSLNLETYTRTNSLAGDAVSMHLELSPETKAVNQLLAARLHITKVRWRAFGNDRGKPSPKLTDRVIQRVQRAFGASTDPSASRSDQPEDYGASAETRLFTVGAWKEVIPRFDSRVTLGEQRDPLGIPRPVLDWKIGQQEKLSLIKTLETFGRQISANGQGRIRIDLDDESPWPWEGGYEPGLHQMGTTRMSASAQQGVVDANCKMHEVDNLFVAGSSVFPTYGVANPTMTILALTLRLADHLKRQRSL